MSINSNKQAVLDMQDAISRGDLEGMFANMTDDVTLRVIGTHRMAERVFQGKEDITNNVLMVMFGIFDENGIKTEIQSIAAEGDKVFLQFTGKAKTRKDQSYDNEYVQVFSFRDGKISGLVEYLDTELLASILS